MDVWQLIPFLILIGFLLFVLYQRAKQLQQDLFVQYQQIQEKDVELQTKNATLQMKDKKLENQAIELQQIRNEKAVIEAKYQKKVKAAAEKNRNLEKYKEIKKDTRTLRQQIEDIVGKGPKWLPHSCKEESSHQIGKPKGGKGAGRFRPVKIHETRDLFPHYCEYCDVSLEDQPAYFVYDAVIQDLNRELDEVGAFDIIRIKNILQRIHRRKCPICHHWIYPNQGLFKSARFGIGFICHVISERILLNLTYGDIILNLQDHFGAGVSLSTTAIIDWFLKFEEQLEAVYVQLEAMLKEADFAHVDESGMPMMGKNWWLWVVCTANLILYHQSPGRGHKDIQDILDGFKGTIIADFFRVYEKFDSNPSQKCLAHLLSTIIELMVKTEKENERIAIKIQTHEEILAREKEDADALPGTKKRGPKPKGEILTPARIQTLEKTHQENLKTLSQAEKLGQFFRAPFKETIFNWQKPLAERISKAAAEQLLDQLLCDLQAEGIPNPELQTLVKRCLKFRSELFTYLDHQNMPPDNNRAERNLRKFAKQRKISGSFNSPEVGKQFMTYLSLFMTCKVNKRDFNQLLREILSGNSVDLRAFLFPNSE